VDDAFVEQVLEASGFAPGRTSVQPAGAGDYCRAYRVNDTWIFLVARHDEGTRSLQRTAAILPALAPTVSLTIPDIAFSGTVGDPPRGFVGYRPVPGIELSPERYQQMTPAAQRQCAIDLARFLRAVHAFPVAEAEQSGIVACGYPFCATEDGMTIGPIETQFQRDLAHALDCPHLDQPARDYCMSIVQTFLDGVRQQPLPRALLHGEVSADHIMFDSDAQRICGIIDFNGMIIDDPARDFLYMYEDYGLDFMNTFLSEYGVPERSSVLQRLHFYHQWLTVLRLLWAWDRQYEPGIARRLRDLDNDMREHDDPTWRANVS
jgi:aminoglycoside 2''-phosphotransferase